jgi:hypothetical protein
VEACAWSLPRLGAAGTAGGLVSACKPPGLPGLHPGRSRARGGANEAAPRRARLAGGRAGCRDGARPPKPRRRPGCAGGAPAVCLPGQRGAGKGLPGASEAFLLPVPAGIDWQGSQPPPVASWTAHRRTDRQLQQRETPGQRLYPRQAAQRKQEQPQLQTPEIGLLPAVWLQAARVGAPRLQWLECLR